MTQTPAAHEPGTGHAVVIGASMAGLLAALHGLGLGEDWLRAVLWGNGARLFGLSEGSGTLAG